MMQARINNPAMTIPGAFEALQAVSAAAGQSDLPRTTVELVHLRASQINGCGVCVDMHSRGAKAASETDERLFTVAAWRDSPYFDDAERAALALTEAATRISDRPDPVSNEVFDEAAKHFDDQALPSLIRQIAMINAWNRLNVTTRQVGGEWTAQYV
jgi:AhpD family alkylhydroperoxidase